MDGAFVAFLAVIAFLVGMAALAVFGTDPFLDWCDRLGRKRDVS